MGIGIYGGSVFADRVVKKILATLVTAVATMLISSITASTANAAGISVTPNTNDIVGLKSNNPTSTEYPNTFPLGARVCNTSGAGITGVTAALTWGTATGAGATNINSNGPTSIDLGSLATGACLDAYYSIVITRAAASFDSTHEYSVSVTGSGGTSGATPINRRIYVERLLAQNRNNTRMIAGAGGCNTDFTVCDSAPTGLVVGDTYTFKLYGDTATSQSTVEAFLDFPGTIFRVISASSTASLVTGSAQGSVPGVYNDACVLQWDYTLANYKGCTGTGGAGGDYAMTYSVKVISAGTGSLKAVIYDGSAGNWHLNSDYGSAGFTTAFTARWPLDVSVTGSGDVISNPAGVSCGVSAASCQGAFSDATSVTLTATPSSGQSFTGWSGSGCSGTGTCTVSMTQARAVSATFTGQSNYPLSVSVVGLGSVSSADFGILSCTASSGVCSHSYTSNATVTLTATALSGQSFAGWSGGECVGISTTCTVTTSQARNITANFASSVSSSYNLSVTATGNGLVSSNPSGISCGATCSADFASGASVTLTAVPTLGATFAGWGGGTCTGTAATCAVTMDQLRYVTATFATSYTLTVGKSGAGAGVITSSPAGISCGSTCSYGFDSGTGVTLTAIADDGSIFTGWSGAGCSGTGTCVVSISQADTVTATFATSYALEITLAGSGSGTVSSSPAGISCGLTCSYSFGSGSSVTLTALPGLHSEFAGWSGTGTESCSGATCDVAISQARSVTATFTPLEALTVSLAGSAAGGSVSSNPAGISCGATCTYGFNSNTVVTLTATPSSGAIFNGWTGGGCSGTGTCVVTMTGAVSVTASFTSFFTLSVNAPGAGTGTIGSSPGGISCGVTCSDSFADSTEVTLTATPDSGSVFTGWSGGGCSGTSTCVVTMSAARSISASFEVPPLTSTTPVLTGNPKVGSTLTASDASPWSGSAPIAVTYQWRRCDINGLNCVNIADATSASYLLVLADAGLTVVARVTGTNTAGSYSIDSAATPVIVAPPINLALPVVSGNGGDPHPPAGTVLSATDGTWAGDLPMSFARQWQHCDQDETNCADIAGATGSTYTVTGADVTADYKYRIVVTATNAIDQVDAIGAMPALPESSGIPVISGTTTDGETLTTTNGSWNGTQPMTFSYQWQRCDSAGVSCVNVSGATQNTLVLTGADVTHTMRVAVTATNSVGVATRTALQTAVIAAIAPANVTPPAIAGGTVEGATLTAGNGTWSGSVPLDYSYQWQRCDSGGLNCVDVSSATASTYLTGAPDAGSTMRVVVTATNPGGSASAPSPVTSAITLAAPTSNTLPVVSGNPIEGETLSTTNGTWNGTGPFTYSYQWQRCNAAGTSCLDIDNAYASTYAVSLDDIGFRLTAVVTASNAGGADSATATPPVGPVDPRDPVVTTDPSITGSTTLDQVLTADNGQWDSPSAIVFTHQWRRCDLAGLNCVDIVGATSGTYTLVNADVGSTIRVLVTATNATGQTSRVAAAVGPVIGLAPENTLIPTIAGNPISSERLTAAPETWDSFELATITYQWQRCDSSGAGCADITSETGTTYDLVDDDIGSTVRVVVRAQNSVGSATANSLVTAIVTGTPIAVTLAARDVTDSGVLLSGSVQTRYANTTYLFEYGTTAAYGSSTTSSSIAGSNTTVTLASFALGGLSASTTYHFRITASNSAGNVVGTDVAFTTAAAAATVPDPGPDPLVPVDFGVALTPAGQPQEKVVFLVDLPGAGNGTATGRVKYDRRYAGPRARSAKAGKSFVAFSQKFKAVKATGMNFKVRLNRQAMKIIRKRGFLRINVAVGFRPADGSGTRTYKQVVRLRPFTILTGTASATPAELKTTVRTPRRGRLRVVILLRDKRNGKSRTLKSFSSRMVAGGTYPYAFTLSPRVQAQIGKNTGVLMIKSYFQAKRFPLPMWRTRIVRCPDCSG